MLNGIGCSKGYAVGKAEVIRGEPVVSGEKSGCSPDKELARYNNAAKRFEERTRIIAEDKTRSDDEREIMTWHAYILKDPYMDAEIKRLLAGGSSAEMAVISACETFSRVLMMSPSELIRQRTADMDDVRNVMLRLLENREEVQPEQKESVILIADTLTPSMTLGLDKRNVCAVAAANGGYTSHPAILARAVGIPAVLSVEGIADMISSGDTVIVDGTNGIIIPNPDDKTKAEYEQKAAEYQRMQLALAEYADKPTYTASGKRIGLAANIVDPEEAVQAKALNCDGIGLFRTEFLFMDRQFPPGENEQFSAYKKTAEIMDGKMVMIRTLDVGADKIPSCLEKTIDPHSDLRGIRYCLKNIELFKVQLRAILRASVYGDVRILIPMVSTVEEIRQVKELISEICIDFSNRGILFNPDIQIGAMAETAAACITADLIAKEVDFISIGTNDLTQYVMAANRQDREMRNLCNAYQPAVLRAIRHIIACCDKEGTRVGICGEAAADLELLPTLLGFNVRNFSVSLSSVLDVRKTIGTVDETKIV